MTAESISAKYARLLEAIKRLETVTKDYSYQEFLKNFQAQDAALYNLVIGVEAICDIGNHILAERFQDYAERYKDVLLKLGKHKVIPLSFAKRTAPMAGFRNLAIHVYEGLSMKHVYDLTKTAPNDFRRYAEAMSKYI